MWNFSAVLLIKSLASHLIPFRRYSEKTAASLSSRFSQKCEYLRNYKNQMATLSHQDAQFECAPFGKKGILLSLSVPKIFAENCCLPFISLFTRGQISPEL